ncbi:MAG TPA: GNAT family N-acetyltransferase [Micropepsaceae bacterium]|nr:GNAT family N-acetyltransferase [Micropepsaceae bacterium]
MIEPKIVIDEKPDSSLRDEILRPLRDYNVSRIGAVVIEPLAIFLRHPGNDAIIGGLWGTSAAGWLHIELLYVPEEFRTRGLGSSLIKRAEEIAAKRGCVGVRLDTFSFQAPGFYEKLGYRTFGKLVVHPEGHEQIYYFKNLTKK